MKELYIVPEPKRLSFDDQWFTFDGFQNLLEFLAHEFNVPKGEFNQLLVQVTPYSDEFVRDVASEIKDRLGKEGVSVAVTFYNKPDEHWGKQFFDGLNLVLQLLAFIWYLMASPHREPIHD